MRPDFKYFITVERPTPGCFHTVLIGTHGS